MINYSFIIPHHNCPDLLTRLLNSIPQRQDIQIIVVDDNSDSIKQPKIERQDVQVIHLTAEMSRGAGHARNVGLQYAKGRWLLFADSDDCYKAGFIEELDKYVNSDIEIVLFNAYINYISDKNYTEASNYLDRIYNTYLSSNKNLKDIQRVAMTANAPWNKMYKREFIIRIGAKFEEIPFSNDAWFVKYSGSKASKVAILNKRLYYYIANPNNLTNKKRALSDYYLAIKSNTRRNILLRNLGLTDLIEFPGFNKKNIIRDFGYLTYCRLIIYKIFHDPTYLSSLFFKLKNR